MSNSEQWLKLTLKVAVSYRDETRGNFTNSTDRNVMIRCINTLLSGKTLSDAQQDAFVRSIRMRVGGQYADRFFPVDVRLTRDQLINAKSNRAGILTKLTVAYEYDFERGINLRATYDKVTTELPPTYDQLTTDFLPTYDKVTTNLLPTYDKNAENINVLSGLVSLTERNETKRNETEQQVQENLSSVRNRMGLVARSSLASPSDEVALTPPKQSGSPGGSPVAFSHSPSGGQQVLSHLSHEELFRAIGAKPNAGSAQRLGNVNPAGERDYNLSEDERAEVAALAQEVLAQRGYVPEQPKKFTGEIADGIRMVGKNKIQCSLWEIGGTISGEVIIGLEKFYVRFEAYHDFEKKVHGRHSTSLMDQHWLRDYMWHEVGGPLRKSMSTYMHQDGLNITQAISALYSDRDCKLLAKHRVAVRAYWSGQSLEAIEFYNGTNKQMQKVRVNERRSAGSPSYKEA
jgi:hypothetical protein